MPILEKRIYYIDSSKKLSGTDESFTYTIQLDKPYTHAVVLSANIPITYYMVESGFNYFTLQEGAASVTVSIDTGNYSSISFINQINSKLNAASPNNWTYNLSMPNQYTQTSTAKYTYTVTGNGGVQPAFIFDSTTHINEQMGFSANTTNTFSGDSLTSTNVVKFVPEDTLFIHSNLVRNYEDDILQEIYNDNNIPFSNSVYKLTTDPEIYAKTLTTNQSNVYTFELTDEHGHKIQMNGLNILITLCLFNKDILLREYLKYNVRKELNYLN